MLQPLCRYTRGVNQEYGNLFKSSFAFISLYFRLIKSFLGRCWQTNVKRGVEQIYFLSFNREKSDPLTLMG